MAENTEAVLSIMEQHHQSGDIEGFKLELYRLEPPLSEDQSKRAQTLGRDPEIWKSVFLDAARADQMKDLDPEGSSRQLLQGIAGARILGMLDPEKAPVLYQHFAGYAERSGLSLTETPLPALDSVQPASHLESGNVDAEIRVTTEPSHPELPYPRVVLNQPVSATPGEIGVAPVVPPVPASDREEVMRQIREEVAGQIERGREEEIDQAANQPPGRRFGIPNPFRRKAQSVQQTVGQNSEQFDQERRLQIIEAEVKELIDSGVPDEEAIERVMARYKSTQS